MFEFGMIVYICFCVEGMCLIVVVSCKDFLVCYIELGGIYDVWMWNGY